MVGGAGPRSGAGSLLREECWLHGSRFDLRSGEPTTLPAFEPVAVYPVQIDGDDLLVDLENPINNPAA